MLRGFTSIVEERIKQAQKRGEFNNLKGAGKPIDYSKDAHIPEDLRLAHKMLKNAGFIPPEVQLKKTITKTEDLLAYEKDPREKYKILKKLNFLTMKLNSMRPTSKIFDPPEQYQFALVERIESGDLNEIHNND